MSLKSIFAVLALVAADIEPAQPDFVYSDEGSIILLRPLTTAGWDYVADHIPPDSYTLWAGAVPVQRNLFQPILDGIDAAGLTYTD